MLRAGRVGKGVDVLKASSSPQAASFGEHRPIFIAQEQAHHKLITSLGAVGAKRLVTAVARLSAADAALRLKIIVNVPIRIFAQLLRDFSETLECILRDHWDI